MSVTVRGGVITPFRVRAWSQSRTRCCTGIDAVTAHFTRVPVTRISLGAGDSAQFGLEPMLAAARLLGDARVRVASPRTVEPAGEHRSGNESPGGHDG